MPFSLNESAQSYSFGLDSERVRPRTMQSATSSRPPTRPTTARPSTSAEHSHNIVVLTENRSRQVGFAICNLTATHTIELVQLADNQSYSQALALLHVLAPVEIVIPKSQVERVLFQKVITQWGGEQSTTSTQVSAIKRMYFDEDRGESLARSLTSTAISFDLASKYLALSSLAALVKYVEHTQHVTFSKGSVNFVWREPRGRMSLDFETIRNLELLTNARTGSPKDSLFGVINHTKTSVGAQFLRAQLLSPVNDATTLNTRLDCEQELLADEATYFSLLASLGKLPDLDSLLSALTISPKVATPHTARATIASLIALKHTMAMLPTIAGALEGAASSLLQAVKTNLSAPALGSICALVDAVITEDTTWSKSPVQQRQQECFAVRPGTDGNLDAVRKVYVDCLNEIHELAESYRIAWEQPGLKLNHNATRGYHLVLPSSVTELREEVVQVVKNKNTLACSTDNLLSLNDRVKENLFNIYVMTNIVIQETLSQIRGNMQVLFKATESIALLDMLLSFARLAESSNPGRPFVRPTFTENGPLCITKGRHPILDRPGAMSSSSGALPCIPNDVYLGPGANFKVLTGPNCSGKSTYLKMSAIVVILGHLGCFVPAEVAVIRLSDRVCSRLGTGDDIESNASTFLKEMKETAFILESATDSSFIIIDELGRGTSNEDGVGIAWAVCEQLLSTRAHTLFVTHFHELVELAALYPNVRNSSMTVQTTRGDASHLQFTFAAADGSSPHTADYGIQLAEMCGLPNEVIADAKAIKEMLLRRIATAQAKQRAALQVTAATSGSGSVNSSGGSGGSRVIGLSSGGAPADVAAALARRPVSSLIALGVGTSASSTTSTDSTGKPPSSSSSATAVTWAENDDATLALRVAGDMLSKFTPLLPYCTALASIHAFDDEHLEAVRQFLESVRLESTAALTAAVAPTGGVLDVGAIDRLLFGAIAAASRPRRPPHVTAQAQQQQQHRQVLLQAPSPPSVQYRGRDDEHQEAATHPPSASTSSEYSSFVSAQAASNAYKSSSGSSSENNNSSSGSSGNNNTSNECSAEVYVYGAPGTTSSTASDNNSYTHSTSATGTSQHQVSPVIAMPSLGSTSTSFAPAPQQQQYVPVQLQQSMMMDKEDEQQYATATCHSASIVSPFVLGTLSKSSGSGDINYEASHEASVGIVTSWADFSSNSNAPGSSMGKAASSSPPASIRMKNSQTVRAEGSQAIARVDDDEMSDMRSSSAGDSTIFPAAAKDEVPEWALALEGLF